ncbi:hypothetical protein D3C75_654340 [compost metagenome]
MAAAPVLSQRDALFPVRLAARGVCDCTAGLFAVQPEHHPLLGESDFCLRASASDIEHLPQLTHERALSLQFLG